MVENALYELVLGSGSCEGGLVERGEVPSQWVDAYHEFLYEVRSDARGQSEWDRRLFQPLHYASTHLGLRYGVWKSSSGSSNADTEKLLSDIQFETEEYLWSALPDMPCWSPPVGAAAIHLGPDDRALIAMCFDQMSPVCETEDGGSFHSWKRNYEDTLRGCASRWGAKVLWPRWVCMAIHFASFYIDLYQAREIDLEFDSQRRDERSARTERVLATLGRSIANENVLRLIRVWLLACDLNRDVSGLPMIGKVRRRTGQFISVRTVSELFLLHGLES